MNDGTYNVEVVRIAVEPFWIWLWKNKLRIPVARPWLLVAWNLTFAVTAYVAYRSVHRFDWKALWYVAAGNVVILGIETIYAYAHWLGLKEAHDRKRKFHLIKSKFRRRHHG